MVDDDEDTTSGASGAGFLSATGAVVIKTFATKEGPSGEGFVAVLFLVFG